MCCVSGVYVCLCVCCVFKLGSIEEPVFHSSKFALVDRQGLIRGYYDGVQPGEVSQSFSDFFWDNLISSGKRKSNWEDFSCA